VRLWVCAREVCVSARVCDRVNECECVCALVCLCKCGCVYVCICVPVNVCAEGRCACDERGVRQGRFVCVCEGVVCVRVCVDVWMCVFVLRQLVSVVL